jgi:hypothetical protein
MNHKKNVCEETRARIRKEIFSKEFGACVSGFSWFPSTGNRVLIAGNNAWCFSTLWFAWRTSIFDLSAMVFCDRSNEFFLEVNHYGSQF